VAERFGVSTTPVREAFAQLAAEGLVRIDPHRGAVVFRPTAEDLLQYYEIREVLETLAVSHAAGELTPQLAKELGDLIERMRRTKDPRRWLQMNDEFHLKLYETARRPHLSSLIANLRDASNPYIYMFVASAKPTDEANAEHQQILDACVRGDARAAQRAVRDHLRHTARELAMHLPHEDVDS
jgi:DNA-binding GntR family transcriptional regulator